MTANTTGTTSKAKTTGGANAATKSVEDTIAATKETMDSAVKAGQETAVKNFEQAVSLGKEQFDKAGNQFFEGCNDVADFHKANVDAVMAASTTWAKGFEAMGRAWFDYTRSSMEQSVGVAKAMMTAKTLKEVVDLQSDFAKTSLDGLLAETTKLQDTTMKTANEAITPLSERVNVAVEKMGKPLAA
ncbi:MAG: phasin family protein [Azospirillaceae bacterium]